LITSLTYPDAVSWAGFSALAIKRVMPLGAFTVISPRVSILMYHQVGKFPSMEANRANYCDHRRFARQMGLLHVLGIPVLDLGQALAGLAGERPLPPRSVVLTFDDGYDNFADFALPVLARFGFTATVYAISGWLGQPIQWYRPHPGRPRPRLMDGPRLREIQTAGMTIGSHTVSHARLAEIGPEDKRRELIDSKAALEDWLGTQVRHLCYPFGHFDLDTVHAARAAGYVSATTCLRGAATAADHPLVLPRKAISFGDNLLGFAWKLGVKDAPKPELRVWRQRLSQEGGRSPYPG
jgi:peptidoglycan/xylan/chitin deacetylase (PgdA/CDA1 family)